MRPPGKAKAGPPEESRPRRGTPEYPTITVNRRTPRQPRKRRWPHLDHRDAVTAERADCIDCGRSWRGRGTRQKAAVHAVRAAHRVAFTRTQAVELRPKGWPL